MADETRWYSLRVISGKEKKIRERLIADILRSGWAVKKEDKNTKEVRT